MGRTALYRDPVPWRPPRAEVHLDGDALILWMPDGRCRRHSLDGCTGAVVDGFVAGGEVRRFVRMLVIDPTLVLITPPDQGAVAPYVVRVPEAPPEAAILDVRPWEALADWVLGGGRLGACAIAELARLAAIATSSFAALIGEVAAQRALELRWVARGPLRGSAIDVEAALAPLAQEAKHSARAAEALVSALAHAAGARRYRRR